MKPLYWVVKRNPREGALWEKLEELPIEFDEFTELFSRQVVERKLKKKEDAVVKQPKVTHAKLLDSKRSQNVGILIKSLGLDIEVVRTAVMDFDLRDVDLETIEKVYESVSGVN